jgi:hypothetical protein
VGTLEGFQQPSILIEPICFQLKCNSSGRMIFILSLFLIGLLILSIAWSFSPFPLPSMHKSRQLSTTVLHGKKSKAAKIPEYQTDPMVRQILLDPNLTDFFRQYTVPGSFADRLFKGEPG